MLKKVASKLRLEDLYEWKKEQSEVIMAEKYKIIEKHLNMEKMN
jgi:hypothetical protein